MSGNRKPMGRMGAIVAATLALAGLAATDARAADARTGLQKAGKCRVCHGIDGLGKMPDVPHIGGESTIYLTKQLKAFRSGERVHPVMSIIAKGLSDDDIGDLAAYYAAIKVTTEPPKF